MDATARPPVRERTTAAPTRQGAPAAANPNPTPPAAAPKDQVDLSQQALTQRLAGQNQQLILGATDGALNKAELVALANQRKQSEAMAAQFGAGPLTSEQRDQLQGSLQSFDQTLQEYRGGDFNPAIPKDAPYQTPQQVFDGMGFAQGAEQLRQADRPWNNDEKVLYRIYSSNEVSIPDPQKPADGPGPQPLPAHPVLGGSVDKNFGAWDKDGSGNLSPGELEQAMRDPNLKGDDATALMILRRNQAAMGGLKPDGAGVSQQDLAAWQGADTSHPTVNKTSMEFEITRRQELPATGPLSQESFDPSQIKQGSDGTCILLTSMASKSPEELRQMVTDNGNGTYTVKFADGRTATVPEPTEAQRRYHSTGPNGERWPAVMELAARDILTKAGQDPDKGVPPEEAFRLVTGQPGQTLVMTKVPEEVPNPPAEVRYDQLGQTLTDALARGGPVIAGTANHAGLPEPYNKIEELRNGLVNGHMYSVQGFDPETNQVTLRNPHGQGEYQMRPDGVDDGTFKMPLDEFYANFFNVVVPR